MKNMILILAIVLILFVLAGSVVLHLTGVVNKPSLTFHRQWALSVAGGLPETLKAIDLTGDGKDEVFVQTPTQVVIASPEGKVLLRQEVINAKTTMGDFNGDGVDNFAVARPEGHNILVTAYTTDGEPLWESRVPDVGSPTRGTSLDFEGDGKREVIFGTDAGVLVCLEGDTGQIRWQYHFPSTSRANLYVRGSDDVQADGHTYLAAGDYGGHVVVLEGSGEPVWQKEFPESLRRLRAYDMNGDGTSEILLGGLHGQVWLMSAKDGSYLWQAFIGSRVNEARFLEIDGDPSQTEVVLGGKNGGVSTYSLAGSTLWKHSVSGKVLELSTLDYNDDGRNELLVVASKVYVFDGSSGSLAGSYDAAGSTLDTGDFGKHGTFLVGTSSGVSAVKMRLVTPPLWYSPITLGLLVALIIAIVAVILSRMVGDEPEKLVYTAQDITLEGLRARKKMLREELADIERMQREGEITADVFLNRSRGVREQIAVAEAGILKIKPDYQPELMRCPSCGGPLEIGADRCPYCHHVLL